MLALYHFSGAICAQKVRLALAEKGVEWESVNCSGSMLRDPEYLKLNPNGVVPTLIHDEAIINESRIISEYVEDAFDGPSLMPSNPRERHRARLWSKQIDDSLHLSVFILTFATMARDIFLGMSSNVRANAMPGLRDPIKRRISNDLLEDGLESPWTAMAVNRFRLLIHDMEQHLEDAPYLAGESYSLADADYTAYLNRLVELGMKDLWTGKSAVTGWWDRMQERASYEAAILDWNMEEDVARYRDARDRHADIIHTLLDAV